MVKPHIKTWDAVWEHYTIVSCLFIFLLCLNIYFSLILSQSCACCISIWSRVIQQLRNQSIVLLHALIQVGRLLFSFYFLFFCPNTFDKRNSPKACKIISNRFSCMSKFENLWQWLMKHALLLSAWQCLGLLSLTKTASVKIKYIKSV